MARSWRVETEGLSVVKLRIVYTLAAFIFCIALAIIIAPTAKADYQYGRYAPIGPSWPQDSNKYVPEYFRGSSVGTCYNNIIGYHDRYYDYSVWYGPAVSYITYDSCEMRRLGATSRGWTRLKRHERAHSRGWDHYDAPRSQNGAYYRNVNLY